MSNTELIRKKSITLTGETHARLMGVAGFLQAKRGANTTSNQALEVLLEGWEVLIAQSNSNPELKEIGAPCFETFLVTEFIKRHL